MPSYLTSTGSTTSTAGFSRVVWTSWTSASTTTATSGSIWRVWNVDATNVATTINDPWDAWHTTTTATTIPITPWDQWVRTGQPIQAWARIVPPPRVETDEEVVARAERRRIEAERAAAAQRARDAAGARAYRLLRALLTPEQRADLEQRNGFFVEAPSGNVYRIWKGSHGNVKRVDPQNRQVELESLCIQPSGVPDGDAMLAQKLLIETTEELFRATANITDKRTGRVQMATNHRITGEKLAEVLPFPGGREAPRAAA